VIHANAKMSSRMPTASCLKKNELDLGTLFFAQGGVIHANAKNVLLYAHGNMLKKE